VGSDSGGSTGWIGGTLSLGKGGGGTDGAGGIGGTLSLGSGFGVSKDRSNKF
jgi:hypothetical protein